MSAVQLWELLASVYAGIVIGIVYSVFRLLRLALKNKLFTALLDALFLCCALLICACMLLFVSAGRLRLFLILGVFVGFWLHFFGADMLLKRAIAKHTFSKRT